MLLCRTALSDCGLHCESCTGWDFFYVCHRCQEGYRLSTNICWACDMQGCSQCPESTSVCQTCRSGYFNEGLGYPANCKECTKHCTVCDNPNTCIKCNVISNKTPQNTCQFSGKKLGLILGLCLGIPAFIALFILCSCIYSKRRNQREKAAYLEK